MREMRTLKCMSISIPVLLNSCLNPCPIQCNSNSWQFHFNAEHNFQFDVFVLMTDTLPEAPTLCCRVCLSVLVQYRKQERPGNDGAQDAGRKRKHDLNDWKKIGFQQNETILISFLLHSERLMSFQL